MDLEFDNHDLVIDDEPREYTPVPDGWYDARIMGAELKTTKAGNGRYISVRYDITGNEYAGRVVFGNVTINNPNAAAEAIGRKQLSQIALAGGMSSLPKDTDELVGIDLKVKVTVRPATEQYAASNDVRDWKPQAGGAQPPAAKPKEANSNAPWAK
ncbi:MAG: DUF669 domain-containing protein [Euryarchaeota archaeon]|nr:DUF669 domain-containing protein [Euryarchaeota archaeon]NDG21873.1 DUF669 domain-containing protein [Euryarchaeota archaeon]